jgi:RES domain-containing protein
MLVYRITTEKYSNRLSASGAANRWNQEGEFVIYAAQSRSLASLELVVHRAAIKPQLKYKVLVVNIDIPKAQIQQVKTDNLPNNWRSIAAYDQLQLTGSKWYTSNRKLVLQIPSAVIPQESNFIINTQHELFGSKVSIESTEHYFWDERLL